MSAENKTINNFETLMKKTNKVSDGVWNATTDKRQSVIIPKGITIYDTDEKKFYMGDGSTAGGVSSDARPAIRIIPVNAAASGTLSASATTDKITWPEAGSYLRTGDYITLAAGAGTLPSGLSATTYYIKKDDAPGSGEADDGTAFKVATTRANAIAGTTVDILSSGAAGYTAVIAGVVAQGWEDVIHIDPAGAAVDVVLPDANSADSNFKVSVKKDTGANAVTIKELDASGNVSASGSVTIDSATGYKTLRASVADYGTFFPNTSAGEWFSLGLVSGAI